MDQPRHRHQDYIGTKFTTGPDARYHASDQQFANLYWFRADLFERKDIKDKFKAKYGYDLGVPLNWSAYEDIAEFFTNDVKQIDGKAIYGHMDYGKKDPIAGLAFHRCVAVDGRYRRHWRAQRLAHRRMGHSRG